MSTPEQQPPPWRAVFAGARGRLTTGLLLLEALVAIEIMVVATILPAVEADLHGLSLYGWVFVSLTLASFVTVPIAGRMTDRLGPRPVLGVSIAFYVVGLVLAAASPTMLILVVARFVQGIGGGGLYTVSLGTVAKTYPADIRPRVMALLASMWILPGLLGPPLGALVAETIGWRWAFLVPLPAIAFATVLVMPVLRNVQTSDERSRLPIAASLVLMFGAGALLAGLTDLSVWSVPLVVVGLAVTIPALRRITPPGTLVARRGLPAASAAAFLASAAFFGIDGFVTLMLTQVRGQSLAIAGVVLTCSALAWALGSWWQSRVSERFGTRWLTTFGALLIAVGERGGRGGAPGRPARRPVRRVGDRERGDGDRVPDDPALGHGRGHRGSRGGRALLDDPDGLPRRRDRGRARRGLHRPRRRRHDLARGRAWRARSGSGSCSRCSWRWSASACPMRVTGLRTLRRKPTAPTGTELVAR